MKTQKGNTVNEKCNECGKSVEAGTGLFVNRVNDFNDIKTRIDMEKLFPEGDFICPICAEILFKDYIEINEP